jgi:hypothetical protein
MSSPTDLIALLKDGTGPDISLDIALSEYFGLAPKEYFGSKVERYSWENNWITTEDGCLHREAIKPSRFTSSLPLCLSIAEGVRDNKWWHLRRVPTGYLYEFKVKYAPRQEAFHAEAPRAVLMALLEAAVKEAPTP